MYPNDVGSLLLTSAGLDPTLNGLFGPQPMTPGAPVAPLVGAELAQAQQAQPAPMPRLAMPPAQAPLVSRDQIAAALQNALQPAAPTQDDRMQALAQMLIQAGAPRNRFTTTPMSHIANAAAASTENLNAMAARRQAAAMKQAEVAMRADEYQQRSRRSELDMALLEYNAQFLPAKEKLAYDRALQDLENARQRGDLQAEELAIKKLERPFATQKIQAEINLRKAQAGAAGANAAESMSGVARNKALENKANAEAAQTEEETKGIKAKNETINATTHNHVKLEDGTVMMYPKKGDGEVYMVTQPDSMTVAGQMRELARAGLSPEELQAKRAELLTPRTLQIGVMKGGKLVPGGGAEGSAVSGTKSSAGAALKSSAQVEDGEALLQRVRGRDTGVRRITP